MTITQDDIDTLRSAQEKVESLLLEDAYVQHSYLVEIAQLAAKLATLRNKLQEQVS